MKRQWKRHESLDGAEQAKISKPLGKDKARRNGEANRFLASIPYVGRILVLGKKEFRPCHFWLADEIRQDLCKIASFRSPF